MGSGSTSLPAPAETQGFTVAGVYRAPSSVGGLETWKSEWVSRVHLSCHPLRLVVSGSEVLGGDRY